MTSPPASRPVSVLFVCLGNICRSPLAEGVFTSLLEQEGMADRFRVDSAGTGSWHVGEPPDRRAAAVARRHGIRLTGRARRTAAEDLDAFDWVIAMDTSNLRALERLGDGGATARLHLLREFEPEGDGEDLDVPDPYYGGDDGFQRVYEMIERCCRGLLDHIRDESSLP